MNIKDIEYNLRVQQYIITVLIHFTVSKYLGSCINK